MTMDPQPRPRVQTKTDKRKTEPRYALADAMTHTV